MNKKLPVLVAAFALLLCVQTASAREGGGQHPGMMHGEHAAMASEGHTPGADSRTLVPLPELLRTHILANMRDHLLALAEIQQAMADDNLERAAETAERRLGMSAMQRHGAHRVGQFMPKAMASIGTEMHRAASRFARAAADAAATGELAQALAALAEVTHQCVACHTGFRVQ